MKISEICDINKVNVSKKDRCGEIQYLDTSSITKNAIEDLQIIDFTKAPSRAQRKVEDKTIVYSTVRPNLQHFGILENPPKNLIVSTGFATIDIKEQYKEEYDPYYLFLLLSQNWVTERLQNIAENSTTSYPSITPQELGVLDFSFPDITTQKNIARTIKNVDSKIRINAQINRNLAA